MRPQYRMNLGEFIRYNHIYYSEWNLKIYVDNSLRYNSSIQNAYVFGYDYLNVIEWFRDKISKTIKVYTEEVI